MLIVFFAILHGIVVLPVILSLIGPDAHPPKAEWEDDELAEEKTTSDVELGIVVNRLCAPAEVTAVTDLPHEKTVASV